jgi:hypothetical protein
MRRWDGSTRRRRNFRGSIGQHGDFSTAQHFVCDTSQDESPQTAASACRQSDEICAMNGNSIKNTVRRAFVWDHEGTNIK